MDEQEFKIKSAAAMEALYRKLSVVSDRYEFEPDFNAGALTIEFEDSKTRFVVSPNAPVRQIWVSAHSKSFKLSWDAANQVFALPDGQSLDQLIAWAVTEQIGEQVAL